MATYPDLSSVASIIGDPSRAGMLAEMLSGDALTATELATRIGVAPSTASGHLAKLRNAGLVACDQYGRQRWYRLAHGGVAQALESLGALTPLVQPQCRDTLGVLSISGTHVPATIILPAG